MRKISIMLAALAVLSVSAVCPANTTLNSITTTTAQADTFTIGVANKATAIKENSKGSAKTIKTIAKGVQVQVFGSRNGYYYVGYGSGAYSGLGYIKSSDLTIHTCYR